jgi:glutaminyl-tRNA synthetase
VRHAPTAEPARVEKAAPAEAADFIRRIVNDDLKTGKNDGRVATRFPPEPNGYLHIGHAKSICLNFGIARDYDGTCNLRFDDTNPSTEEVEYIDSITQDVRWLGFEWNGLFYASDYYQEMYDYAELLVNKGKAYVCDLSADEVRGYRGTLTKPGRESPYRARSPAENLELLRRMKTGDFPDGSRTLRAKIDMASPNLNLRDPVMYRIKRDAHPRTGTKWCLYPMYDYAHPISDAIEGITHSICTLEFEAHRPLYDWFLEDFQGRARPQQIEFARLNLTYTVMSKRKLKQLVDENHVRGWDDPRMPTLAGFRRRGYTPEAIRNFADLIGVAKADSMVDVGLLEYAIRQDLEGRARRVMCVLRPLKVVLTNWPEGKIDEIDAPYFPDDAAKLGTRRVPIGRELYIEADDFMEEPPKKFYRLAPGREVRLRYGYIIKCERVVKNDAGIVTELHCTYDPQTQGGSTPDGRKVQGTIHWVCAERAQPVEVRLYDRLFKVDNPGEGGSDFAAQLNPQSLEVVPRALAEPSLATAREGERYQFERLGYFGLDPDSRPGELVFNRTVSLRDSWAKIVKKTRGA